MKIDQTAPAFRVPIRLWLAAQAMQGLLGNPSLEKQEIKKTGDGAVLIAKASLKAADALIAEYNRTTE